MTLPAGTRLGPYEVVCPLGKGGMGEVYRARDTRLGREVAVKVVAERIASDPETRLRFLREARAVAALSHPNIVAIHDVGSEGSLAYAVIELLDGETLRQLLKGGALPLRKAVSYAVQTAQGLASAHEQGVIHRDLKPENLFVTRDGRVKILDFGLAKIRERPRGQSPPEASTAVLRTETGVRMGTAGYMAPEQVRGLTADHRSDIFSFGAVLFEMLSGERAFGRETEPESMTAILRDDPPDLPRSVPAELRELVFHCLEKVPDRRFQSAADLAFALRVFEREDHSSAPRPDATAVTPDSAKSAERALPSIAVLPFRNLSADVENEYFSDGMTEEIIGALSRLAALRVASRTSSFAFKGKAEDVRAIGARLGVRTVLEGSVRRAGSRLRISAQLVDVADGYQLWSERYDREMEDVFAVQDDIARAIADALKVRLLGEGEAPLVARGTDDVEAYNLFLKGRYFFNRRDARSAVGEFGRALERDPRYTAAWTGLADSCCIFGFYGGIDTRVAYARAREAAEHALALEPGSADVQLSVGILEHYFGWSLARQERALRTAIELAPRSAAAYSWLALRLGFEDRPDEALELARKATHLEPYSANFQTNVGWAHFGAGRLDDAAREFRRALAIDPNAIYPLWALGLTRQLLGGHQEAVEAFERARSLAPEEQTYYVALLAGGYAAAGRTHDARRLLAELERRAEIGYVAPFHLAFGYTALGDADAAFDCLERARVHRNALTWWVRTSMAFESLRSDPRFEPLVSRIAKSAATSAPVSAAGEPRP